MKSNRFSRTVLVMTLGLATTFVAAAQSRNTKSHFPPGPCHQNVKRCASNMQSQLNTVRAYVTRLKPGDKVSFNPQPDPPGNPDPWYRRARIAFGLLQEEIADLAQYPPSERKVGAIKEAQEKFGLLAQASDTAAARSALAAMKPSIRRLSN